MSTVAGTAGGDPSDSPLEDVSLVYFDASPTDLGPFEASRLRWKIDSPIGVQFELAGTEVPASGEEYVEPPATRNYQLVAKARNARKTLGLAQVAVDLRQCRTDDLSFLDGIIKAGILADPGALPTGAYFREDPKITIAPERINIHLFLGKPVHSGIRDVDITMDMSFGLTVVPDTRPHHTVGLGLAIRPVPFATRLGSTAEEYSGNVTEPWYVYATPLIGFPLMIALALAQDSLTARIHGIIQRIVDGLDAVYHPAGFDGLQKHSVTIGVDDKNIGYLECNWCPPPPARQIKHTDAFG
jgi:hypothetical protein